AFRSFEFDVAPPGGDVPVSRGMETDLQGDVDNDPLDDYFRRLAPEADEAERDMAQDPHP
ncbi:MAG TPA: hypothetical protein VLF94_08330, partial [Chlamydiales bacterium]|nr:hypothetical protein [Chlamydiales bacterium]